jgi:glycosyltransferase involved in cell wall biosynthesis
MWGAQRTLLTLLSAIDRRVYSPLLVVPNDGPFGRKVAELGIPVFVERLVHWVPGSFVSSRRKRLEHLYLFLRTLHQRCRAIERLISNNGVDVVYTNTVICVEGAIAAQRTRKPHVWHIHEPILRNSELAPLLPFRLYCATVKLLSTSIIFCSRALAGEYPQLSRKASLVYNGLPSPPARDRIAAQASTICGLGIHPGAKLVAVIGALNPRKDHLNFLAAAEQVARRVEEAIFLIVGSGSENNTNLIRQQIRDLQLGPRVKLLGWWDGDIHDLLAAIDVLVISSEQESFGLTAIEALAMETPVVSTRCGGPEEILVDGVTGLLVPVKDPLAMADAIVRLLSDPVFARRLGARGRIHVSEHFGVDRYVQGIQRVIQEASST